MQDRYAGDIGDFSKVILLNSLVSSDLRLGIVWYLNKAEEANTDGTLIFYQELRQYDPDAFDKLSLVAKSNPRSVAALEASDVLPRNAIFFGNPVPTSTSLDSAIGSKRRAEWMRMAVDSMEYADVILLDPDNGIAPAGVARCARKSVKHVYVEEITSFLRAGHSLVLYQHHQRKALEPCIAAQINAFSQLTATWALSFHKRSLRTYFVLAQPAHQSLLWNRTIQLVNSPIGIDGCFRLHVSKKVCSSEGSAALADRSA